MKKPTWRAAVCTLVCAFAVQLSGCGGGGGGSTPAPTVPAPQISAQPIDARTVAHGPSVTFSVTATGTGPMTYQWRRGGVDIPGQTASSLTLSNLTLLDDGALFSVVVSNAGGSVQSLTARLWVSTATLMITTAPADALVQAGQSASFSIEASSTGPLSYQWQRNGADVPGAQSATYAFAAAGADNGSIISVKVTNVEGVTASREAVVRVDGSGKLSLVAGSLGGTGNADALRRAARFSGLTGLNFDSSGRLLVADASLVRRIASTGQVSTLAGQRIDNGITGISRDGPPSIASFWNIGGIVPDQFGNTYVSTLTAIRLIASNGTVSTIAGNPASIAGSSDGVGGAAHFYGAAGLALDADGNVIVADMNNATIRRVTPAGIVTTIAGLAGVTGFSDGPGNAARFAIPKSVAVDAAGNIFVVDAGVNGILRKIATDGTVTTLAGRRGSFTAQDGQGTLAQFADPAAISIGPDGNLFVLETQGAIRKVTPAGAVTTVGTFSNWLPYGSSASSGLAVDAAGNIYAANTRQGAIHVMHADGSSTLYAGSPAPDAYDPAHPQAFNLPSSMAADSDGNIFVADSLRYRIIKVATDGTTTPWAGSGLNGTADGARESASFDRLGRMTVDAANNVYVVDGVAIRKIGTDGQVSTFAGKMGEAGSANGSIGTARFTAIGAITTAPDGNFYVVDGCAIRRITSAGVVSDFVGQFNGCISVDGTGAAAGFRSPYGLAADAQSNLYLSDSDATIRRITPAGVVTTLAGMAAKGGMIDGKGTTARFLSPWAITVSDTGDIYVADQSVIRKVSTDGTVVTVAGTAGQIGFGGPSAKGVLGWINDITWSKGALQFMMDRGVLRWTP